MKQVGISKAAEQMHKGRTSIVGERRWRGGYITVVRRSDTYKEDDDQPYADETLQTRPLTQSMAFPRWRSFDGVLEDRHRELLLERTRLV